MHLLLYRENKIEGQQQFFIRLDEAVKSLQSTCMEQTKRHQLTFKKEYDKVAHAFIKLSRAFDTDPENSKLLLDARGLLYIKVISVFSCNVQGE